MISGSRDCTSVVWDVSNANNTNPKPFQTLLGHDLPVTCVAIATELDMAVSGSQDGTVNVYSIHQGLLVHCLAPLGCVSPPSIITFVAISFQGHIAFSSKDKVCINLSKLLMGILTCHLLSIHTYFDQLKYIFIALIIVFRKTIPSMYSAAMVTI